MYTKTITHKRQILVCQVNFSGEQFDIDDLTTECDGTQHFKRYRHEVLRQDNKIPRLPQTHFSVPKINFRYVLTRMVDLCFNYK